MIKTKTYAIDGEIDHINIPNDCVHILQITNMKDDASFILVRIEKDELLQLKSRVSDTFFELFYYYVSDGKIYFMETPRYGALLELKYATEEIDNLPFAKSQEIVLKEILERLRSIELLLGKYEQEEICNGQI